MTTFSFSKQLIGLSVAFATFALAGSSFGQLMGEDLTLTDSVPFVRFVDTVVPTANWQLLGTGQGFRVEDDENGGNTPFRIELGARHNSLVVDDVGRVALGRRFPLGVLDIQSIDGGGNVIFNPDETGLSSISVSETGQPAELMLETTDATKSSLVTLAAPGAEFAVLANGIGQAKFTIRDQLNGRNAFTIFPSALHNNTLTIRDNRVGIGFNNPAHPLQMQSGARCTVGGVWTNACSRELKDNIQLLDEKAALAALNGLAPVTYHYKADVNEKHVGFIAEDVPELVASQDRKALAALDISAVLTKVVQSQQTVIDDQATKITEQDIQIESLQSSQQQQAEMIAELAEQLQAMQSLLEQR